MFFKMVNVRKDSIRSRLNAVQQAVCSCVHEMARVQCGSKSKPSQNITVPVARHLYPSAAWVCFSVTSMAGVTRTPTRRLLFMFYSKILFVNVMYVNQPISIEFVLVFLLQSSIVFVPQCQPFKKYTHQSWKNPFQLGKVSSGPFRRMFYQNSVFLHQHLLCAPTTI